ncbi:MAG: ribonuclease Z [Candidatus Thermofonsia bacterium]|nr:MAG: ribonuclease Z [Candidatus Thermofonsia bacterium]
MFELIFLGTSSSAPSVKRGLSSHLILHRQYRFLLDCGEGTQRQILKSGLGFKRLNTILLTHSHLDHILGLGGLLSTLARWENQENINIYGGKVTLDRVRNLLFKVVFPEKHAPLNINLVPLENGPIMEDDKFRLSAFPVSHRGADCYGFLFEEKPQRPFLADKADALGVPFGPERKELVLGNAITLADGRTIYPDDVLDDPTPGTRYVHIGDVGRLDNLAPICQDADVLVMESTYTAQEDEMARQFGHMTAARAAQFAREMGVKTLILTHLSRRYFERDIRQEARTFFRHTYVARDFDHFQISRNQTKRLKRLAG